MIGKLTRRRIAVAIVALFLLTPLIIGRALNSPRFQNAMLGLVAQHTPWKVAAQKIQFSLWDASLTVDGLDMLQQKTQHHLQVGHLQIRLNPWAATIAQLGVRSLEGDSIVLDLSHGAPPGPKDSKRLDWSRILLLKNLKISRAMFTGITVLLPNNKQIRTRSVGLAFVPTLLRQINLTLNIKETELQSGDVITTSVDKIYLRGETNVSNWQNAAPYINDIEGNLKVDEAYLGENQFDYIRTTIHYKDLRMEVNDLDMLVNTKQITGKGFLDVRAQKYQAHIDIPQPIEIRQDWDKTKAISLRGTVQGKIHVEGEKFDLKEGNGKFNIDITQVPGKSLGTTVPLQVVAKGHWEKGILTIDPSTIKIQDGIIQLSGKVDLDPKNMNIPLTLRNVPLAPVFGRFNDESFHPIAGVANGQGVIRGWGKGFVVDGTADVTNAAYTPMVTERAHVAVKATSDKLTLNGDVYQGGRVSGRCDMSVAFSHQEGKGTDILNLKASLDHHNLAPTMKTFDWMGIATATYEIHGPTGRYTATGKATITDGKFSGIPYKSVTTTVRMIPKQVVFEIATLDIPRLPVTTFSQPITLKFSPGMFTFDGRPTPQLSLRGKYRYVGKVWHLDEIAYTDKQHADWRLVLSGTSSNGNLNVRVRGIADAAHLNLMRETFRDVTGPAAIDGTLHGPAGNPSAIGTVTLKDNTLLLRASPYRAEELQGTLRFNGHELRFDNVRGAIEDGSFTLAGAARFERYSISNFDLKFSGKDIRYAAMGGPLRLEMDTELTWTGTPKKSMLSGDMIIQNGLYARNFSIFDQLTGSRTPPVVAVKTIEAEQSLGLNLRIRNAGEIRIRNNAANVTLSADIHATGTEARPHVVGIIQAEEGTLNYVGIRFNIARGLVEYRGDLDNPYIEFVGDRDIYSTTDQNYLVTLTLSGPLNNLKYDLSSSPPQDRASLISLILTGAPPGAGISGSSYAAGQVGAALAAPLASALYLDTVRLETGTTTSLLSNAVSPAATPGAQRLYLGKRLSERMNLAFSTDVGGTNPQQSVVAEYTLTDYLLIKGGQSSNQNFGFNFTLRFRERE